MTIFVETCPRCGREETVSDGQSPLECQRLVRFQRVCITCLVGTRCTGTLLGADDQLQEGQPAEENKR